jgi:hypothetical protein
VEEEVSVLCHTEAMDVMDMAPKYPIIQPPVVIHFMEGPFMGLSSGQAVEGFHGVVAVVESSAVGADSVVGGGNAWGNYDGKRGSISTTG